MAIRRGDFAVDYHRRVSLSGADKIQVCKDGLGIAFNEEEAKDILLKDEIHIDILMGQGDAEATAWGCDLTYIMKINGDYRT